eukprot:3887657-Amphidinium_carterae.1
MLGLRLPVFPAGVAPPYIRLVLDDNGRSSHEVCLLCRKEATESHMYSDKHRKKEDLFKFGRALALLRPLDSNYNVCL